MDFLTHLQHYIQEQHLFEKTDKLLLAVSGGMDSMVMATSLQLLGYEIHIAHCNFQLRGEESESEEVFVKMWARSFSCPFYSQKFDTQEASILSGNSIQMSARALRYDWFEKLRLEYQLHYILTAHHLDDVVETVLYNLVKGTGIAGLHGILPKRNYLVRPLLFAGRSEIERYAFENQVVWKEDSSNASTKYARNLLRLEVVPLLKKINPQVIKAISTTADRILEAEGLIAKALMVKAEKVRSKQGRFLQIEIQGVLEDDAPHLLLYHLIQPFGFTHELVDDILRPAIVGAMYYSASHRLVRDRTCWILDESLSNSLKPILIGSEDAEYIWEDGRILKVEKVKEKKFIKGEILLDVDSLVFPLIIRPWQQGDKFQPLGMQGTKKISDFLVDEKIHLFQKEKILVVESEGKIAAVLGHRPAQQYSLTPRTTIALSLVFL